MSLNYRSNLSFRPPVTPDIQRHRMQEMSAYGPATMAPDVFASSLNLPAYQRAAEDANRSYGMANQSALFGLAGEGLGQMAQQQSREQNMKGSLLGALLRGIG